MKYPLYCCTCCGFTNGDMFQDWLGNRTPTQKELIDFEVAKRVSAENRQLKTYVSSFSSIIDLQGRKFRSKK